MTERDSIMETPISIGWIKWLVIAGIAILVIFLFNPLRTVSAGQRGILLNWGAPVETLDEGIHFIIPIAQDIQTMNVRTEKYQIDADSASADLQSVITTVAVNYHIIPEQTMEIFQKLGRGYEDKVIAPALEESVKATSARYTAEQLITKREEIKEMLDQEIKDRLTIYNIKVDGVNIVNFKFSDQFNTAIEAKVTAEQNALKAQRDLERIKFEAQQKIEEAKGVADSKLQIATAEAKSIELQGEALRNNPQVASLRAIEKWNGILPIYMFGGSSQVVPFVNVPLGQSSPTS